MFDTKILLVDDCQPVRDTVRELLLHIGFRNIDDMGDVNSALAKMRDCRYGLVISDLRMEPRSGLDFLREVRADDALKDTPFIIVTGFAAPEVVASTREAGVSGYIVKPFNAVTLKEKVESALGCL